MKVKYFVGIDTSKATLDFSLVKDQNLIFHTCINNNNSTIQQLIELLHKEFGATKSKTIFCIENTGLYTKHLIEVLSKKKLAIWLESPLQIKHSLGIQRGKSDKVDSFRIAQYAYLYREKVAIWSPPRELILSLKHLNALRIRLKKNINCLSLAIKENKSFLNKDLKNLISSHCSKSLEGLTLDLKRTEASMLSLIDSDENLKRLYSIVTSVESVGPVLAIELIIATNEFKNFSSSKKLACYCGVAPFEFTSGSSVRGRTQVNKFANRRLKAVLHTVALSAISHKGNFLQYYDRKVAEGKSKMSVINAIRNKILHRIFACVKESRLYTREH